MKIAIVFLALVVCVQSAKFPSNFKKCNRKDPDAVKCILDAAQDGFNQLTKEYPHINLASFSPMEITELKIGAGSQAVVNVDQNFKNCKIYGIDKAKIETFNFNFEEKYLFASLVVPEIKKFCEYELNGRVLLLPIVGKGPSTVILNQVNVTARFDYEEVKKKNKTYFHFINQKITLDPESVSFNFENLFNGTDKALGDNINKVLNENNKEVFADVRKGYEEGFGLIFLQIINNLFQRVSIEEAFD